jgi:hypothetical protein
LRDILVGHGVRSVGLGGGVCVLRVAVVVFHGERKLNDGPADRFVRDVRKNDSVP